MTERMTEDRFRRLHELAYEVRGGTLSPQEQREVVDELWSMRLLATAQKEYIVELAAESARSMNRHRQHLAAQCIHSVVSLYIAGCFDPTHWECEINEGLSRGALELADEIIRQSEQEPTQ